MVSSAIQRRRREAKTLESMANETSAIFESVFSQAAGATNNAADRKYQRGMDILKRESAAEDDRAAKRHKSIRKLRRR
ncbi:hypothetical protein ColLi_11808 [Colletotrichum liriopes]|uniref:Uncharacterized protein n=1 Tax=Colletotrichum liriopes TaxID=708192 RepID=A0AA37GX67_9PEZI|nr:hypothetical protein ColLi_11808 [Colletotrichum liriopes]